METQTINLEQIYKELINLKREIEQVKTIVAEDFELADDVLKEFEESRGRAEEEFISDKDMKKEFG